MQCPICGKNLINSWGDKAGGFLIVSPEPDEDEIKRARWWSCPNGTVFTQEFQRVGIQPTTFYFTGAWKHKPSKNKQDLTFMKKALESEIAQARGVLLIGGATTMLLDAPASSMNGAVFKLRQFPEVEFFVCTGSFNYLYRDYGAFRFGFEKYIKEVKQCLTV